jgi:hypothetical protein
MTSKQTKALVVSTVTKQKPVGRAKGTQPRSRIPAFRPVDWQEVTNYAVKSDTATGPVIVTNGVGNVTVPTCYPLNPCNADLFPWLGPQAAQYQKFRIRYIDIMFKSTVKEYALSGQQGRVYLAFQKDPEEPVPNTIAGMASLFAVEGSPSQEDPLILRLTARELHADRPYYFCASNTEALLEGDDPKLLYPGLIFAGSYGCATNDQNIGELYVRYGFDFCDPILTQNGAPGGTIGGFVYHMQGVFRSFGTTSGIASGSSITLPDNASNVGLGNSIFGLQNTIASNTLGSTSINLDPGNYMVHYNVNVLSANITNPFVSSTVQYSTNGITLFDVERLNWTTTALTCQPYQFTLKGMFPLSVSGSGTAANGQLAGQFHLYINATTAGGTTWSIVGSSTINSGAKPLSWIYLQPLA